MRNRGERRAITIAEAVEEHYLKLAQSGFNPESNILEYDFRDTHFSIHFLDLDRLSVIAGPNGLARLFTRNNVNNKPQSKRWISKNSGATLKQFLLYSSSSK